ncbi:retrovirus-related pol polyprotein from transposon TNT 1-94 [Tanacetum coccineum]
MLSALRRSSNKTASVVGKPCQGDSFEFYLITGFPTVAASSPFIPMIAGQRKPEGQWTKDERKAANLDQRLKSLIMFVFPDDQMNYVINCLTAKSTWDDLILYHEGPSDVKESMVMNLKMCYSTFKFKEGETLTQTFTRNKALMNELVNDGIKLSKLEINTSFINGLPKKWLSFCQSLRNTNHVKDYELASLFGKLKYEEKLIDTSKVAIVKNKGLIAKAYEWDEEEVSSNDNQMVEVKVLMALAEEDDAISKEGAINEQRNNLLSKHRDLVHEVNACKEQLLVLKQATLEFFTMQHVNTEILKENKNLRTELKELTAITETWLNSSNKLMTQKCPNMVLKDPGCLKLKVFILPNHDTGRILPAESQRNTTDLSVVVTNSSATEYDSVDECSLYSTPIPLLKKLDGVKPIFGSKTIKSILRSKSTFKGETLKGVTVNEPSSAPAKGNKISLASKVNSAPASKLKSVNIEDDPPLAIDHLSKKRNQAQNPQHVMKSYETCGSTFHTTTDHNDIKWFIRGEELQVKKAEALKSSKAESSNANRSKTPTKSQLCDAKYIVQFDEKRGTIFNSNKEVVMIAPRVRDVYVLDMTSSAQESCFFAKASENLNWLWHKRLAHLNFKTINKLAKQNLVIGLPSLVYSKDKPCSSCEKGKHHRASFKTKQTSSIKKCLHLLHMDLFGPVTPRSINHEKYTLVIVDEYSRYTWVYFLKKKSQAPETIMSFIKRVENQNDIKVKQLRTDNGIEFRNSILVNFYDEKGISQNFSSPYIPEQNGVAERKNRTLIEAARTMLSGSVFSKQYWTEVVATACYTQNRSTIVKRHLKTPYEIFRKRIPNINFLHVFGCSIYIHNHKDYLGKFNEKADVGYLLRYSLVSKAFRVFNTRRRQTKKTYHITFDESPYAIPSSPGQRPLTGMLTRAMAKELSDASAHECLFVDFVSEEEPKKVSEALKHLGWVDAMQDELNQFARNKFWTLVPAPYGKTIIGSKWVFRNKRDKTGIVIKNKARLVAQGYNQQEGINYDETFALVARL